MNRPGSGKNIWCAIPVYNNKKTLRRIVEGCLSTIENVLVVDDGCTDTDVSELLSDLDIILLRHEKNMGKGKAILTASRYVEDNGGVYMVTIDADGQHDPEDMKKFFPLMNDDGNSLIIGCRNFNTENVPQSSRFGRKFANFWLRVEAGVHVDDCQSGYRAYPVKYLNRLKFSRAHYDFEAEALAKFAWAGIPIKSVEVQVKYPPPPERVSHFRPYLDNLRLSLTHTMLIVRRLLPIPHKRFMPREKIEIRLLLHPVKLMRELIRENASPGGLAASAAIGIFLATLPLLFLHTLVILYVATKLNLNKLLAINVQHFCMPPFIPALCIEIGFYIRNDRWLTDLSYQTIFVQFSDRLIEWFIGSLIVGPVLAVLAGIIVYFSALIVKSSKLRVSMNG